jgi:putative flippase GtrA
MARTIDQTPLLQRLRQVTLLRYAIASLGALAIDYGSFLALLDLHVRPAPASALGYTLGIIAHWLLSSRKVFADQIAPSGLARTRQKALFLASALIGLALTTLIVGTSTRGGGGAGGGQRGDPRIAKLLAIVTSFTVTWLLRQRVVFR